MDDIQGNLQSFGANLQEIASATNSLSLRQDEEDLSSLNAKVDMLLKEDGLANQGLHEIRETVKVLPHLDRKLEDLKNMMDATPSPFSRRHHNGVMVETLRNLPAVDAYEEENVSKVISKLDEMDTRLRSLDSFTRTNNVAPNISAKLDLMNDNTSGLAGSVGEHERFVGVIDILENLTTRLAPALPDPSPKLCSPDDLTRLHDKLDALKRFLEVRDMDSSLTNASDSTASVYSHSGMFHAGSGDLVSSPKTMVYYLMR